MSNVVDYVETDEAFLSHWGNELVWSTQICWGCYNLYKVFPMSLCLFFVINNKSPFLLLKPTSCHFLHENSFWFIDIDNVDSCDYSLGDLIEVTNPGWGCTILLLTMVYLLLVMNFPACAIEGAQPQVFKSLARGLRLDLLDHCVDVDHPHLA